MSISSDDEKFLEEVRSIEGLSPEDLKQIETEVGSGGAASTSAAPAEKPKGEEEAITDMRTAIGNMELSQKLKLAMFGDATARGILIGDSNRLIQAAVLKNPQLQDREIETFTKNPNLSDQVLRTISDNRSWMKSYVNKVNLVNNPKVAPPIALKWLRHLMKGDLRKLSRSKNVSSVISTAAKKRLADMMKR